MTAVELHPVGNTPTFDAFDVVACWDRTWQVRATSGGTTVFTCLATRPEPGTWILDECRPGRRSAELPAVLMAAADHVRNRLGPGAVVAVHPAEWQEQLAGSGARPLQRIAHLGLMLDDDHLRLHHRPLPDGLAFDPLPFGAPDRLAELSPEADRTPDRAIWRSVLAGGYGPVIAEASVMVTRDSVPCAAVAITEHRGRPLVGHCITGEHERGYGLGRAVLVESLRQLVSAGYAECRLNVVEDNWIAYRLYRSVGFTRFRPPLGASLLIRGGSHRAT